MVPRGEGRQNRQLQTKRDGSDIVISVLLSHVYDMKNFSQFKRSHLILVPRGEGRQNRQLQTKREREKAKNGED